MVAPPHSKKSGYGTRTIFAPANQEYTPPLIRACTVYIYWIFPAGPMVKMVGFIHAGICHSSMMECDLGLTTPKCVHLNPTHRFEHLLILVKIHKINSYKYF